MTHPEQHELSELALEALVEGELDGMATAIQILFNEAMRIERSRFLQVEPHERTEDRTGYANGYKPKTVKSRVGELDLRIPQTRNTSTPFYPQSLERGRRSERALSLTLAEMYVQGVSTRKAQAIVEELSAWRERETGAIKHLILDARYEKVRHGVV